MSFKKKAQAEQSEASLLSKIESPADLRQLPTERLPDLAREIRGEIIRVVSRNGGHLGASLGVVELSIALHYVFNTPDDKLIWDVGHQCYAHKLLTGRKDRFDGLRREGGLSGFTRRSESVYDPFGAGHSSTSVSAAVGMAAGRDLQGRKNNVISVIGDGSMSAGMVFEALNNAGDTNRRMIVILNDNDMSIARPVGAPPFVANPVVQAIHEPAPSRFGYFRPLAAVRQARGAESRTPRQRLCNGRHAV